MRASRKIRSIVPCILILRTRGEKSNWRPCPFIARNKPGPHWIRHWVSSKAGLNNFGVGKISCPFRDSKPRRPARSLNATPTGFVALLCILSGVFVLRLLESQRNPQSIYSVRGSIFEPGTSRKETGLRRVARTRNNNGLFVTVFLSGLDVAKQEWSTVRGQSNSLPDDLQRNFRSKAVFPVRYCCITNFYNIFYLSTSPLR